MPTIAGEAIRDPVPGPGPTHGAGELPKGPLGWFAWIRRPSAQDEAGVSGYEPLHCSACSAIIGVYEPLVVRVRGEDRASSLAAEPALPLADAEHLHLACAQESPPPTAEVIALTRPPPVNPPALAPRSAKRRASRRRRVD